MFDSPDEVIDLTNQIDNGIPVWPSFPPVDMKQE